MKIEIFPPLSINELGQRNNQEDTIYPKSGHATISDRLFLVCDGMGGHERGEVASSLVCSAIPQYFQKAGINTDNRLTDDDLLKALEYAFQQLDRADDGASKKMGTTLTLLYIHRGGVTCAHIGDSRIYHISPSRRQRKKPMAKDSGLLYVSRDHSLVFELYQAGEITYEEMRSSPQKNIITRAMQPGEENRVRADIVHIANVRPDDYFYLCTDGMLEGMENEEVVSILSSDLSDKEKLKLLIAATMNNQDNHSAYLIHVKQVIGEIDDKNNVDDEQTTRANACNIRPQMISTNDDDVSIVEEYPHKDEYPPTHRGKLGFKSMLFGLNKRSLSLVLLALLIVIALLGYKAFKPEKNMPKVETPKVVPPKPKPMNRHKDTQLQPNQVAAFGVDDNKATKDSDKVSEQSENNDRINGKQQ